MPQAQWDPDKLQLGSRNLLSLELKGFSDGVHFEVPFHVFIGRARQPRALMIAGVHGDEYESVAVLQEVAKEIEPASLAGALVIVPVANPQAFYAGTRRNPVDFGDLNRSFPGDVSGTMTERLADLLFQELVLGSDAVLSMHCWSREAVALPYVEYSADRTDTGAKSFAMARALDVEFLHPYEWNPGLLVAAAARHGIPSVEPEVGGMGTITAGGQNVYRRVVYHFLEHLKMIGPNSEFDGLCYPTPKIIDHSDCPANQSGLFRSNVGVGDTVRAEQLLGTIHDLAGNCLEEIRAPRAGVVGILRSFSSVLPGNLLLQLFWEI